jgi:hypothetical protein
VYRPGRATQAHSGLTTLPRGGVAPGRGFEPRLTDPELSPQPYSACLPQPAMWNRFALIIDVTAWDNQASQVAYHVRQVSLRAALPSRA